MNTTDHLKLICGNPKTNAAAFSRFVFPFAYRLQSLNESPPGFYFQPKQAAAANYEARKKYLTLETVLVLFERAKWFEITQEDWQNSSWEHGDPITVKLKTGSFQIKMLPPSLVLFEFSDTLDNDTSVLQTGFLFVDIYFPVQSPSPILDDFLLLNELFRYFDMPYSEHAEDYKTRFGNVRVDYNNQSYRTIAGFDYSDNSNVGKKESYFVRWLNLLKIPILYEGNCYRLVSDSAIKAAEEWIYGAQIHTSINTDENCLVHVDNRCFVWTAAILHEGGQSLRKAFSSSSTSGLLANEFGHWIRLLNIDSPKDTLVDSHKATTFEKEWAQERTYKRWEEDGNWYGFNNHSGAMLIGGDDRPHFPPHLCRVFREQYFDQTILLLYLRTTLFRFSRILSLIVDEKKRKQDEGNISWLNGIRSVRRQFSRFAILYQFPSLSNQQQALEMYALARKALDVDELYKEVQVEIANTHDFLEQTEANNLGRIANTLAEWGIPIAVASVVASFFGMNSISNAQSNSWFESLGQISIALLCACIAQRLVSKSINKPR